MIKQFKDLAVGDRCYVRSREGEFLKIQVTKKENGQTYFGEVDYLEWYDWLSYPTITADPDQLVPVYSHADPLPANSTNYAL